MKYFLTSWKKILIFAFIFIIPLLILPWEGFYLLNDSYVYEWSTRYFFENDFTLHPYTGAAILLQTFLGSLIYKFINSDPSLLRLLTYFFSVFGVLFFYKILKRRFSPTVSFLGSLLLFFNPLYFNLSFTFMSDIYFLSTFIISAYYFINYLENSKPSSLFISTVFLSLSFLSRQTALFIVPVFIFLFFLRKSKISHFIFLLIPVFVIAWYQFVYPKPIAYTERSINETMRLWGDINFLVIVVKRLVFSLYYFGFFLFPVTFSYLFYLLKEKKFFAKKFLLPFSFIFSAFFGLTLFFWFTEKELMFYIPNILSYAGFNPQNLNFGIKQTFFVDSPVRIRALVTLFSTISLSALLFIIYQKRKVLFSYLKSNTLLVLLLSGLSVFLSAVIFRDFYDRYLIILLPGLIFFIFLLVKKHINKFTSYLAIFLIILSLITFAFEHDYLSFNKFVWEYPVKMDLHPSEYRGTFEYNAYHRLDDIADSTDVSIFNRSTWVPSKEDYTYYMSYTSVISYCDLKEYTYNSLLNHNFKGKLKLLTECK